MKYLHSIKINPAVKDNETYISGLSVVKNLIHLEELSFDENVTFFIGENGSGKSTILEAIAISCGFNAEGGSKDFNFSTNNNTSNLHQDITPVRINSNKEKDHFFLRAESLYNLATVIENLGSERFYGGKSLHDQSHGESFLSLIQNRFDGKGLYILDEPEAALSPIRQLTLLYEINRLIQKNPSSLSQHTLLFSWLSLMLQSIPLPERKLQK